MTQESFPDETKLTLEQIMTEFGDILVSAHGKVMSVSQTETECTPFIRALLDVARTREEQIQIIKLYQVQN